MSLNTSAQLLISRKALYRLSNKYPNYLQKMMPRNNTKKETDSTPWGLKFKVFAYTCAMVAIPYSMGIVISASPSIRDYLNDDDNLSPDEITWGRKVVQFVRWYWGEDDTIPYYEYLERYRHQVLKENPPDTEEDIHSQELSLSGESSTWDRLKEINILKRNHEEYNLHVYQGDQEKGDVKAKGTVMYHEQEKKLKSTTGIHVEGNMADSDQQILISFEDDDKSVLESKSEASFINDSDQGFEIPLSDVITQLTNVFSTWHYFQNMTTTTSVSSNAPNSSQSQSLLDDELDHQLMLIRERLDLLNMELKNPSSMRAYDDISDEIKSVKQEERQYKSERRKNKLKSMFRGIFTN